MTNRPTLFRAALPILVLAAVLGAVLAGCSSDPPARLPENVTAAIVYNEQADRWHAGALVAGDRPQSFLRVVCITEAGKPWGDSGSEHTGINIDAQPGDLDGRSGSDWTWRLDGRRWEGGRWALDHNTSPTTVVAEDADVATAFLRDLRRARMAELSNARAGEDVVSVHFDLTLLFDTPVQFAIDNCDREIIERSTGDYHSAYAYWLPNQQRHSITLTDYDPATGRRLFFSCGPTQWTDDDTPDWIREAKGEVYAVAVVDIVADNGQDQDDSTAVETAAVSWTDDGGNEGSAVWEQHDSSLRPMSTSDNLRFIEALRNSEQLNITIESADAEPMALTLRGAALFDKPMGVELAACIREYADLNG